MKNYYLKTLWVASMVLLFCGFAFAQTYTADYYNVKSGNGKGLRFWQSNNYKIHMGTGTEYKYGPVTGYSIKMNMSNTAGRGWTWGVHGQVPVAALNIHGNFQTKGYVSAGGNYPTGAGIPTDTRLFVDGRFSQKVAGSLGGFGVNDRWSSLGNSFIPGASSSIYGMLNQGYGATFISGSKSGANNIIGFTGGRLDFDVIGTNGQLATRMSIHNGGNVGIQQTAPKSLLHVGQQLVFSSPTTSGGWGGIAKNMYWNGTLKRVVNDEAADMVFTNTGDIIFRTAPLGGGANSTITNLNHTMRVHNNRGVSVRTDYLPSNVQFNVQGNLTATNHWNTSDGRFKKNVKGIDSPLDKINALNGKSYQFKEKIGDYNFKAVKGQNQLGFIAAELKEVLPELVMEDDKGYQSVNYIGVIPVLVEAMKEQQNVMDEQETTITELNETVESLETRLERLEALLNDSDSGSIDNSRPANTTTTDFSGIVLKQNAPNPFKGITTIDYEIPTELGTASLLVYDLNGKTIATYNIADKGTVRFDASNLSNGTYIYAIVANGQSIATQKMIIQK